MSCSQEKVIKFMNKFDYATIDFDAEYVFDLFDEDWYFHIYIFSLLGIVFKNALLM